MTQPTIEQAMRTALGRHQAGHLTEAETIYRQVLSQQPDHPIALHYLGVIAHQVGRDASAVELIRRSIQLRPESAEAHNNLGIALWSLEKHEEAIDACRQAIALRPGYAEAYNNLGNPLKAIGRLDEAVDAWRQAIALKADYAESFSNLGGALWRQGKLDQAVAACHRAVQLKPNHAEAYGVLANVLSDQKKFDEAVVACRQVIRLRPNDATAHAARGAALAASGKFEEAAAAYRQAIVLDPEFAEAHGNLAMMLKAQGKLDEAAAACRQVLRINPASAQAWSNLGNILNDQGRIEAAIDAYRQAIERNPAYLEVHYHLGNALKSLGRLDEASQACGRAVQIDPDNAEAHWNLALNLLAQGEFAAGWDEYEWRWKCTRFSCPGRTFDQPQWAGEPLEGRTVLLHCEQGFGDSIQFVRFAPEVKRRGGTAILQCPPALFRLFQDLPGVRQVIAAEDALPAFDLHCPLLSLPRAIATRLEQVGNAVPYLRADPALVADWDRIIAAEPGRKKIGLVWAGSPGHQDDRTRSLALRQLAPLAKVETARFFSLQLGSAAAQIHLPGIGIEVIDFTDKLNDFADTAAMISHLDLVIAVDTAVAHLAGAMGKPTWALLPQAPDWRWMLDRDDSPWYPTMRLFRQKKRGDWDEVIARVAQRLGWEISQAQPS